MKILKEGLFDFTEGSSEQFFSELDEAKKYRIFILQCNGKEPGYCKRKNGTIKVISDGISIDSGDSEMIMRKGKFLIDMSNQRSKIYRYESTDSWYCEVWV